MISNLSIHHGHDFCQFSGIQGKKIWSLSLSASEWFIPSHGGPIFPHEAPKAKGCACSKLTTHAAKPGGFHTDGEEKFSQHHPTKTSKTLWIQIERYWKCMDNYYMNTRFGGLYRLYMVHLWDAMGQDQDVNPQNSLVSGPPSCFQQKIWTFSEIKFALLIGGSYPFCTFGGRW